MYSDCKAPDWEAESCIQIARAPDCEAESCMQIATAPDCEAESLIQIATAPDCEAESCIQISTAPDCEAVLVSFLVLFWYGFRCHFEAILGTKMGPKMHPKINEILDPKILSKWSPGAHQTRSQKQSKIYGNSMHFQGGL